jgi:prephenate dehydratase
MPKRLGYLAPPGTYTEEASERYDPEAVRVPYPTFRAIIEAVRSGEVDEGVTAIENSLEGAVVDTLDLLIQETTLHIKQEIMVPIMHCLLIKPGTRAEDIKAIYSHPQALGQCRRFLENTYPGAQPMASLSTAAAVEQMQASDVPAAAIASRRAGDLYGAQVLATDIQDQPGNTTRFVVWAQEDHAPTGDDKTSICFDFDEAKGPLVGDTPGLLYNVIGEFAKRGISMAKIESRPAKREMGRYIFLVDLLGHRQDAAMVEALESVRHLTSTLKVFGSYPRVMQGA